VGIRRVLAGNGSGQGDSVPKEVPITIQFLYNLPHDSNENPTFIAQGVHNTNHITVQCPRFRALPNEAKLSADEAARFVDLRKGTDLILKTLDGPVPVAYTHFEPSIERKSIPANSARLVRDPQLLAPFLNSLREGRSGHPVKDHRLKAGDDGVYFAAEIDGAVQYRMPHAADGETFLFTYQTMLRRGSLEAADTVCYKVAGTYQVINASSGATTIVTLNHATQFLWGGNVWLEEL
jgi:hypothetical protein